MKRILIVLLILGISGCSTLRKAGQVMKAYGDGARAEQANQPQKIHCVTTSNYSGQQTNCE